MTEKRYVKGDYNQNHCEIWFDGECIGDVRTRDADKFVELLNMLNDECIELREAMKRMMMDMMGGR